MTSLLSVPTETLYEVTTSCGLVEILRLSETCRSLHAFMQNSIFWFKLVEADFHIHSADIKSRATTDALFGSLNLTWKSLYQTLYAKRILNWRTMIEPHRQLARTLIGEANSMNAVESMTTAINFQLQSGLSGGLRFLCRMLADDLCLRAKYYLVAAVERNELITGDGEELREAAYQDYCLASLVDPAHPVAVTEVHLRTIERNRHYYADAEYDFDKHYDEEILEGSILQRARFLVEFASWRPDKCTVYLHMYLLCDMLKMWPSRLIYTAKRKSQSVFQAKMCEAWLLFDFKQEEEALHLAQQAVGMLPGKGAELEPTQKRDAAFAYFTLGFVAQYSDTALKAYHSFLEHSPHPARLAVTYNNLGSIYCHRGDYSTALVWLNKAKDANPRSFITYKTIAKCLSKQGERVAAYQILTSAINVCTPVSADMYSERSKYTWLVTPDLNEATRMNPRMSYPYRFRAALYMEAGLPDKALQELKRSIDLTYDSFDLSLMAAFKYDIGDHEGAITDMKTALVMDLRNSSYRTWLTKHDTNVTSYIPAVET